MTAFNVYAEGAADELDDKLTAGIDATFPDADTYGGSAETALEASRFARDLITTGAFGDGVNRYGVTLTGAAAPGVTDPAAPLHSLSLVVTAIERESTSSDGEPVEQV